MILIDELTEGINQSLNNGIINRFIKLHKEYVITLFVIEY